MTRLLVCWNLAHGSALRVVFCAVAIMLAFFLFVLTDAIGMRMARGEIGDGDDRLMVVHKHAMSESLPLSYLDRIAQVPGVAAVAPRHLFNGWFRDPSNTFTQYLVDPARDLALHPEYQLPPDQRAAFVAGGKGVLIGRGLARRHGWRIGDNLALGSSWLNEAAVVNKLAVTVVGVFDAGPGASAGQVNTDLMLIDRGYVAEAAPYSRSVVGWFVVGRAAGAGAAALAPAIDAVFANSPAPTATSTERAMSQRMAQRLGDLTRIGLVTALASFWALMFAVGLYFWQNMTERAQTIAVLRAIGFGRWRLFRAVLAGAMMLCVGAAVAGCALAAWALPSLAAALDNVLPGVRLAAPTLYRALAIMLLLGALGGALAGLRMRYNVPSRGAAGDAA